MPGLAGGTLRLIWTFLPPIMGTRKLVTLTTALFVIPLIGWGLAVQNPDTPYAVLLLLAVLAGIGGGAFSGFMPSTSYFFPQSKQGTALGLQAGIGNFGVSLVQFVTPWIIGFVHHRRRLADASIEQGHGRRQGGLVPERRLHLGAVRHRRRHPRVDPAAQRPGPGPRRQASSWTSSATSTPGS